MEVARGMQPALSEDELREKYAHQQALKQRALFRAEKARARA
jgi:hypothetical protein